MTDLVLRFAKGPEAVPDLKTWSDLKDSIKGLADFLTPHEEAELEQMIAKGTLPDTVDGEAVRRFIRFCNNELLPGINQNRKNAGLPVLLGDVLGNAIMGGRWVRDRLNNPTTWAGQTRDRLLSGDALKQALGKNGGRWGHARTSYLRGVEEKVLQEVLSVMRKGEAIPGLRLVTEYYTYRDADRQPYGFAYSVRFETTVHGLAIEKVIEKSLDTLAEYVYRELPESIRAGRTFQELPDEQRAFYRFCVKTTLVGVEAVSSVM